MRPDLQRRLEQLVLPPCDRTAQIYDVAAWLLGRWLFGETLLEQYQIVMVSQMLGQRFQLVSGCIHLLGPDRTPELDLVPKSCDAISPAMDILGGGTIPNR